MSSLIKEKPKFENNLEVLRGFAALVVVLGHTFQVKTENNIFLKMPSILNIEYPGHISVLIFFILSGYVIGISNKNNLTKETILTYCKKRITRLYPIYLIAVIIPFIAVYPKYSFLNLLQNMTFMQMITTVNGYDVIYENNPIWSLNYEIIFYILFIPISFYNINRKYLLISFVTIGILCKTILHMPMLGSYCIGFSFWLIGLVIASTPQDSIRYASKIEMTNALLLFFVSANMNIIHSIIFFNIGFDNTYTKIYQSSWFPITLADLSLIPFCLYCFYTFSTKHSTYFVYYKLISFIIPFLFILYNIYKHKLNIDTNLYIPIIIYTICILIELFNYLSNNIQSSEQLLSKFLLFSGSISYGIYIIHFPILLAAIYISKKFATNNISTFIVYIFTVILCAYILEKKYHKYIAKLLK